MGKEIDFIVMCRTYWQNMSLYQRVLLVFLLPGLHKALLLLGFSGHLLFPPSFLPWQWGQHLFFPDPAAARAQADRQRAPFLGGNGSFFRLWPPAPAPCPRRCSWGLINIKDYKRGSVWCMWEAPGIESNIQAAAFAGLASWIVHRAGPSGPWAI